MEDSRGRFVGKLLVNDDLDKSSQIVLSGWHFCYFMGLDEVSHDWVAIQQKTLPTFKFIQFTNPSLEVF